MKTILLKLPLFYFLIALVTPLASAQGVDQEDDKKGRTFQVTCFNAWQGPELFVKEKGSHVLLSPAMYTCTKPYKYTEGTIQLFKKGVDSEGEEIFTPVVITKVPGGMIEPLLILIWDARQKKAVTKVIEYSPRKFHYGSYQIVNFSKLTIGGYIGAKTNKLVCKPYSSHLASFSIKEQEKSPIQLFAKVGDDVKKVYGSITVHKKKKRIVYLLYPTLDKLNRVSLSSRSIVSYEPAPES